MTNGNRVVAKRARLVLPTLGFAWFFLAGLILVAQLARAPQIEITWTTETEFDTAGFNVLRSDEREGQYRRINDLLIAGAADASAGAGYRYVDEGVERGKIYYYRLEEVAFDNSTVQHGIVSASTQGVSGLALAIAIGCFLIGIALILSNLLGRNGRKQNYYAK